MSDEIIVKYQRIRPSLNRRDAPIVIKCRNMFQPEDAPLTETDRPSRFNLVGKILDIFLRVRCETENIGTQRIHLQRFVILITNNLQWRIPRIPHVVPDFLHELIPCLVSVGFLKKVIPRIITRYLPPLTPSSLRQESPWDRCNGRRYAVNANEYPRMARLELHQISIIRRRYFLRVPRP